MQRPQVPIGYPARLAALELLLKNEATGVFLKDLFPEFALRVEEQDRPLVQELAMGVVRWRLLLDYNIAFHSKKKSRDRTLRMALRLSAYQLFFLESVPDHAAVHIGVELIKQKVGEKAAGYGNAVLNAMVQQGLRKKPGHGLNSKGVNTSHPPWMLKRWRMSIGTKKLNRVVDANNTPGSPWLRINLKKASFPEIVQKIHHFAPRDTPSREFPYFRARKGLMGILNSDLFLSGQLSIQDPISWYVCQLLQADPGDRVLDLCSAPGGKAACLSETTSGKLTIVCSDISHSRLRKIADVRERLGHTSLVSVVMDGRLPACKAAFDKVLVDAPCSNLGVIRRRPEVKWRVTPESVEELAKLQSLLLSQAALLVKPGGVLLYATCSPEHAETTDVVKRFLQTQSEWRLDKAGKYVPGHLVRQGCLHVYPGETEYDGFFAARLVRS